MRSDENKQASQTLAPPPPSMHMHLGRGLSSISKSRRQISWFDDVPCQQLYEEERTALSESDLLSLFELPVSNEGASSTTRSPNPGPIDDSKKCTKKRTLDLT